MRSVRAIAEALSTGSLRAISKGIEIADGMDFKASRPAP
jgi:hypothetical protein